MSYDPREWAGGRQSVEARTRRDCYGDPLHTPPPPYTGNQEQRSSTSSGFSRAATSFTSPDVSQGTTPVTQDTVTSSEHPSNARPKINTTGRQAYDMRRTTHMNNVATAEYNPAQQYQNYVPQSQTSGALSFQQNRSSTDSHNLPPPPPRRTPPHVPPEIDTALSNSRLGYGRRSTSAGPTPTAGPSAPRTFRTLSGEQELRHESARGMTLPGPPSVPPPLSTRSRSAGGYGSESEGSSSRQRPPRLDMRNSNLTPIPATPNSVVSGTSARPMPFPLRIDTGMSSNSGKQPAVTAAAPQQEPDSNRNSQAASNALARRSAVRGPAARSSGQGSLLLRSRSKSIGGKSEIPEPPSTTLSNNPWASALEQARSPQEESLPESSVLPNLNALRLRDSDTNGRSYTPPATPGLQNKKSMTDMNSSAQQVKVLPTPPLSQKPLLSANSVSNNQQVDQLIDTDNDDFVSQAMRRHEEFLRLEQEAASDVERLQLFLQFMQQESNLRKHRYKVAFESEAFDVEASKNMIFAEPKVRRASARDARNAITESPARMNPDSAGGGRNESGWWRDYQPQLSPIASQDIEESSRGRPPSRWWESATGSQSDGRGHHIHRSKRESKYMSLSTKLLQEMEVNDMQPLYENTVWTGHNEYPDEKANPETFGFYDDMATPPLTKQTQRRTQRPYALDISRFITLPPPYPRHYPAVNNNHPDLTEYRTTVRMLSDLNDAKSRQQRHQMSIEAMRNERRQKIVDIKRTFRANIQAQITDGILSYSEAAEAEKLVKSEELEMERQGLQAEFDTLQDVVINPLHDQLNERIEHLSNSLESLQRELFASAANQNPDQPVQEGDDVPELLEQLTQLKWLFEARETLHTELFDLLSQRNDAYKAIVALPYHQTNNTDKIRDTEAFFEKDAATRHATFCAEALKRHELFLQFVEDNALRGIEMQSSAFWDLTPGLVELLQKIPSDTTRLEIDIPDEELKENPSYQQHPQQYLYLLLRHAEKSSYQYIEGQINLYCLVHEVKTSSLAAHYKASKAQQKMAGDQSIDLADTRLEDEGELTDELKNRAAMIEEQWQDSLGKYFHAVQERVKQQLQDKDAWEEIANDD